MYISDAIIDSGNVKEIIEEVMFQCQKCKNFNEEYELLNSKLVNYLRENFKEELDFNEGGFYIDTAINIMKKYKDQGK